MTETESSPKRDLLLEAITSGFVSGNPNADNLLIPMLIANRDGLTMEEALKSELKQCKSFDMSVAFIGNEELKCLKQYFLNFDRRNLRRSGRIITSTYNFFNTPDAFRTLLQIQENANIKVYIWQADEPNHSSSSIANYRYHPKGYVFRHQDGEGTELDSTYIGSSNLTSTALRENKEWNLKVSSRTNSGLAQQVNGEIDHQIQESVRLDGDWLKRYEEQYERYAPKRPTTPIQSNDQPIRPNSMQTEALMNLVSLRKAGEHQAIIISATGTGKTYLSAFDVRQCHPKRMLYVAQQQQILTKSMESYQKVLGCGKEDLGLLTGNSKQGDRKYVFATVQTLATSLDQFTPDSFDYILIDEAHHSAADSYRQVLDHFKPNFLLGMTATPERTDNADIFNLFGNNIAYNIRLQQALQEDMLCPFHYYGVHEYIKDIPNQYAVGQVNERFDVTKEDKHEALNAWIQRLIDPQRVQYIIDMLQSHEDLSVPVCGLVFCSRQEEASKLSVLFNARYNQQAERPYRTVAVTSDNASDRDQSIKLLEQGRLDYIFTVDLFNEGVDIPCLNQIVMLRQTKSSIIFTQQLGRGLRKAPNKDSVTVIDFIGNYANNYLIPIALYGNSGDRDVVRKNLQQQSIGLSSVSFDQIAEQHVLDSIDSADLSAMQLLAKQYRQLRNELKRIPMLMDFVKIDASLTYTLANKKDSYLEFVRSRERSLSPAGSADKTNPITLHPTDSRENGALKMVTATLLRGLRPHELVILAYLCAIPTPKPEVSTIEHEILPYEGPQTPVTMNIEELKATLASSFPQSYISNKQCSQAFHVLDLTYFTAKNQERFGGAPLIQKTKDDSWTLTDWLSKALRSNPTFATFFADTVQTGLVNCRRRYQQTDNSDNGQNRGFIYGEKYSIFDIMLLCGWENEQVPQNVGGYRLDTDTNSLPILIKYENSQYGDRFLSTGEIEWFSKNQRTLKSNEYLWLLDNAESENWPDAHFVPIFIRRKQEQRETTYYYVGKADAISNVHPDHNLDDNGKELNVVISTLHLDKPVDPQLFHHLTGRSAL